MNHRMECEVDSAEASPRAWSLRGHGPLSWDSRARLTDLPLRTRTRNSLRRARYETVGDVLLLDDLELRDIREFGAESIRDLRRTLYPTSPAGLESSRCTVPECDERQEPYGLICPGHFARLVSSGSSLALTLRLRREAQ